MSKASKYYYCKVVYEILRDNKKSFVKIRKKLHSLPMEDMRDIIRSCEMFKLTLRTKSINNSVSCVLASSAIEAIANHKYGGKKKINNFIKFLLKYGNKNLLDKFPGRTYTNWINSKTNKYESSEIQVTTKFILEKYYGEVRSNFLHKGVSPIIHFDKGRDCGTRISIPFKRKGRQKGDKISINFSHENYLELVHSAIKNYFYKI